VKSGSGYILQGEFRRFLPYMREFALVFQDFAELTKK